MHQRRVTSLLLLLCSYSPITQAATARYRQGRLELLPPQDPPNGSILSVEEGISVATARQYCQAQEECVSFGFESANSRFPSLCERVFFYRHADWHTANAQFIEDPYWHLYVNTTREIAAIPVEVQRILTQLDTLGSCTENNDTLEEAAKQKSSLRSSASSKGKPTEPAPADEQQLQCIRNKVIILDAIFHLVYPKELKATATPHLIPKMIQLSQKGHPEEVRNSAITNLIVMADSPKTAPLLVQAGVYEAMSKIVTDEAPSTSLDWTGAPILALDVISNIAMYRTANPLLQTKGAPQFLRTIMEKTTGFPSLQSTLALLHLDTERELIHLSESTLKQLVMLLESTMDGDVVYGILWDLIPGPLSALQLLVQQRIQKDSTIDVLLDAGLVEQLLRVLEEKCRVASHIEAVLEILQGLALVSQRAREMIYLAAHSIQEVQKALEEFQQPSRLANQLTNTVAKPNFVAWSEEL